MMGSDNALGEDMQAEEALIADLRRLDESVQTQITTLEKIKDIITKEYKNV